jgi:hypothetical protein
MPAGNGDSLPLSLYLGQNYQRADVRRLQERLLAMAA